MQHDHTLQYYGQLDISSCRCSEIVVTCKSTSCAKRADQLLSEVWFQQHLAVFPSERCCYSLAIELHHGKHKTSRNTSRSANKIRFCSAASSSNRCARRASPFVRLHDLPRAYGCRSMIRGNTKSFLNAQFECCASPIYCCWPRRRPSDDKTGLVRSNNRVWHN